MPAKPTYKKLEQKVKELNREMRVREGSAELKKTNENLLREIQERKKANRALRESEEKYSMTFHSAPIIITISRLNDGKFIEVNETFIRLLGYRQEEVIGHTSVDLEILTPESSEKIKHLLQKNNAFYNEELEMCTKGGTIRTAMFSAQLIEFEGEDCIVTVAEDITRQKQAEYAINIQHELGIALSKTTKLDEALALVVDAATSFEGLDSCGIYLRAPANGGFDLAHVKGLSSAFTAIIQHYDKETPNFHMVMKGTPVYASYVNTGLPLDDVRKQEGIKTIGIIPIIHLDNVVGCLNAVSHTVNEIPAASRNALETMASQVGGAIMRLQIEEDKNRLQIQLQQSQKMEAIGTLAGGIAHDFNNILGMIIGNTELALDDIPESNPAHFSLQQIKNASFRAADIVSQLLRLSRKTDQELKPIGLMTVIKDALKFLRSTIPTTIEIRKNIPATDEIILADPIQINQIIMNLCINASQEMEETGGILEITVENATLNDEAASSYPDLSKGDYVKVTVSDTGSGIDSEIIDKIFDPYFTTKEVGKGTGMGLAMVHGIVKNHNGAITVDSELGKGTVFSILFPGVAGNPELEIKITDELPLGRETILFIDDEKQIVDMTQLMLERLGYKVEAETNPLTALELFKADPDRFALVITDTTMPKITGVRLSEKLKEIRSDIPVIICTGHSSLINEEKAKAMGIAAYVMKPILIREIAKTIRTVLDNPET